MKKYPKHELSLPVSAITMWPNYIFIVKYRDWIFDKNKIIEAVYTEADKQESDIDSNVAPHMKKNLKESKFNFLTKTDDYPVLDKIKKFFAETIEDVVMNALPTEEERYRPAYDTIPEVILTDSWYHITNNGGYHGAHSHPGHSWAGIFYIQSKECNKTTGNGINRWHNVYQNTGIGDLGSAWWNHNSVFDIEPLEGHLVVFPAWIMHEATPYTGTEDRIVISFNARVENKKYFQ